MGYATHSQVRQEFEQRITRGEFRRVERMDGRAAPQYTTAEMDRFEQEIVGYMRRGNQRSFENSMLVSPPFRILIEDQHLELDKAQLGTVDEIFLNRKQIVGLDGVAGGDKTRILAVIWEGAEAQGYTVEGFAQISRAAQITSRMPTLYEQVGCVKVVFPSSGSFFLLFVALHVALHRVCIRTLEEPFLKRARCRLGFERRVDAAISRPVLKTKVGSQSSEHGVIATGKHHQISGYYFVKRHI